MKIAVYGVLAALIGVPEFRAKALDGSGFISFVRVQTMLPSESAWHLDPAIDTAGIVAIKMGTKYRQNMTIYRRSGM